MEICSINRRLSKWRQGIVIFLMLVLSIVFGATISNAEEQKKAITDETKQSVEYIEVKTIPLYKGFKIPVKWYATAYQAKIKDLELSEWSAKLCFSCDSAEHDKTCFDAEAVINNTLYMFQFVERFSVVPILKKKEPKHGILFIAKFSGGGSGTLSIISIWVYNEEEGKFINLLPAITITEQGEYKILQDKLEGVLVTADYIWGGKETHFAPHKYSIRIYQYSGKNKSFNLAGEYVTKSKYKSLDDVDKIDVIRHEIGNVQKYVLNKKRK